MEKKTGKETYRGRKDDIEKIHSALQKLCQEAELLCGPGMADGETRELTRLLKAQLDSLKRGLV